MLFGRCDGSLQNLGGLRAHLNGAQRHMVGAGGAVLWQQDRSAAAPRSVAGADAGGRVSPGADQAGHPCCGH